MEDKNKDNKDINSSDSNGFNGDITNPAPRPNDTLNNPPSEDSEKSQPTHSQNGLSEGVSNNPAYSHQPEKAGAPITNDFNQPKNNKKNIIIVAVIVAALVIIGLVSGIVYISMHKDTIFNGALATKGKDYGSSLSQIKVTPSSTNDGLDEPTVDKSSLENLDSIKDESAAILLEGNGETVKKDTNANFDYLYFVHYDYDLEKAQSAQSEEEFEEYKLDSPIWQQYQNSWDDGNSMSVKVGPGETLKTDSSSSENSESDEMVKRLGNLLENHHVGSIVALLLPETTSTDESGQEGSTPVSLVIGVITKANVPDDSDSDDSDTDSASTEDEDSSDDSASPDVSPDLDDGAPTVDNSGATPKFVPGNKDYKTDGETITAHVIKEGTGEEVSKTDTLKLKYSGWLLDGTQFDSSFGKGDGTVEFELSGLIKGWQYGLDSLTVGSQVELVIPSKYAYGSTAQNGIPANSDLVFYIDIVSKG